jgi:hypothetical protein
MPPKPEAREKILQKLLELHSILPPREETKIRASRYFNSCQWLYVLSCLLPNILG